MPLSVLTTITTPHLSDVAKPQLAQVPHASALLKDAKCPLDSGRWVEDPTWHLTATLSLPDGSAVYGEKVRLHLQLLNNFLNVFKDLFTFKCLAALPACMCVFLDTRRQQILELKLHMIATAHIFSSERPTKCWVMANADTKICRSSIHLSSTNFPTLILWRKTQGDNFPNARLWARAHTSWYTFRRSFEKIMLM